jgi:hypothetical protein
MIGLQTAVLVIGLLCVCWSARVNLIFARSGNLDLVTTKNPVLGIVSILAFPAAISFFVGAFLVLAWPWALGLLICALLFFGVVVTRNNLHLFAALQTVLDGITVLCAVAFWATHFA